MELLHGETLAERLKRGRLSPEEVAAVLVPVLSAVGAAHGLGIVHRDLKPDNIFLANQDGAQPVKVLDFGIAKLLQPVDGLVDLHAPTESGTTLGTPCYMAPEQVLAQRDLDHRVDIWALGAIAYECLAGVRAVAGHNIAHAAVQLAGPGVTPLARLAPELPAELSAMVDAMTAREPDERPSLHAVSRLLARYTAVRAPDFAEPRAFASAAPRSVPPPPHSLGAVRGEPAGAVLPRAESRRARRRVALAAALAVSAGLALYAAFALQRGGEAASAVPAAAVGAPTAAAIRPPEASVSEPLAREPEPVPSTLPLEARPARHPRPRPAPPTAPATSVNAERPPFKGGLAEEVPF